MKRSIGWILALALLGGSFGCVKKSANLQKSIAPPDRTLYETGANYLKRGQYIKSRLAFQTLLNTYPDSDMASEAYFAMGDSFYEEGGTENLLQAEDQYKNFIVFYPGDPKSADAQMKIISLNYKMMRSPDRDQQYAHRTLQEIQTFEQRYPNSDYLPLVRQLKVGVEDNLARGDLGVGEFYLRRNNPLGARLRFQEIIDKYKNFEEMDRVLYRQGQLWDSVNNPEAAVFYTQLVEGYPFSPYFEDAKKRLTELGKPIPEVNTKLAAANQANIKPDVGFSPLKPLVDFGKALGFIAPPDQYELAQETIAQEKAAAAAKAAAEAAGDNIQIESEIRKSISSGETTVSTPAPTALPGDTDGGTVSDAFLAFGATLRMTEHNYSATPAERFVIINDRRYVEGDTIADNCVLESITPDGAVLRRDNQRITIRPGTTNQRKPGRYQRKPRQQ